MWFWSFFLKRSCLDCLFALELEGLTRLRLELPHLQGMEAYSFRTQQMLSLGEFSEAAAPGLTSPWLESSDKASAPSNWVTACEGSGIDPHKWLIKKDVTCRAASCNRTCKWNYSQTHKTAGSQQTCIQRLSRCSRKKKLNQRKLITRCFFFNQTVERSSNTTVSSAGVKNEGGRWHSKDAEEAKHSLMWRWCTIWSTSTQTIPQQNTVFWPYTRNWRLQH